MDKNALLALLITMLIREQSHSRTPNIPEEYEDRYRLWRSLVNVRPSLPITDGYLRMEDAFLQEDLKDRGITEAAEFAPVPLNPRMFLWQGDITTLKADAIVNAANPALLGCFMPNHNCIDNAIHTNAGVRMRLACHDIMLNQDYMEPVGMAKITPGFNLPAAYVLHTVGPVIDLHEGVLSKDSDLLAHCYLSCLELAVAHGLKSVAFCCVSTGEFHFPNKEAAHIAVRAAEDFLANDQNLTQVIFNVYQDLDYDIYRSLLGCPETN